MINMWRLDFWKAIRYGTGSVAKTNVTEISKSAVSGCGMDRMGVLDERKQKKVLGGFAVLFCFFLFWDQSAVQSAVRSEWKDCHGKAAE